jgi:hypothetical protein
MKNTFECCHNCERRHIGCHADCQEYLTAKAAILEAKRRKYMEDEYINYVANAVRKMKKGKQ